MGGRSSLFPVWSLHGLEVTIVGTYSSSIPEAAQNSDISHCTTACPMIHTESPHGLTFFASNSTTGWEQHRLGAVIGSEGQRGLAHEAVSEQSHRHLHRKCTEHLSIHGLHLIQHYPPLEQGSQCRKKENHTLKLNRASLVRHSGLLLQQLGTGPHP